MKTHFLCKVTFVILVGIMTLGHLGCHKDDHHDHDDQDHPQQSDDNSHHEDEEKTVVVTHFSDRFEIFLEHLYVVANSPTRFITHITDLETLQPRRTGMVTFVLKKENQIQKEHVEPAPARDGIYIPELVFVEAGMWSITLVIPIEGRDYSVELPPFQVYASTHDVAHAPAPEEIDGISFLKEQQWKILTRTDPVQRHDVVERIRLTGTVSARPDHHATVTPPLAGKLLQSPKGPIPFIGEEVEAGQIVAVLQPPLAGSDLLAFISNNNQIKILETELSVKLAEVEAQAVQAKIAFKKAEKHLNRVQELYNQKVKSTRELEVAQFEVSQAKTTLETAQSLKATYQQSKAQLNEMPQGTDFQDGFPVIDIKAPISGTVVEVNMTVGEQVQPADSLLTLLDTEKVLIEARVPESDLSRMSTTYGATYTSLDAPETFVPILDQKGGRLIYLGSKVDPETRTVPLVYEMPNPQGRLRIGMALNVYVETDHVENALVVPDSALVDEEANIVVFVQLGGETFEKREVEIGIREGNVVQILSGLSEKERVVTKGAYAIRLASVSTSIPAHGHAH